MVIGWLLTREGSIAPSLDASLAVSLTQQQQMGLFRPPAVLDS